MKPYRGEGCWLLSLLVVVSLALSCYCLAIVQAGCVGLTGTQDKTLIGACARARMVRASHPRKLRPGQNLDCCLHAPGETLSGVRPCVCCLLAPPCRRRAPSSSSSHGVVIVVASRPFIVVAVIAVAVDFIFCIIAHNRGAPRAEP